MNVEKLSDQSLLQETFLLSGKERETTALLVKYLAEIERRKLFVECGFTSIFAYCTEKLKMSEGQAHRRIQAARLLNQIPRIDEKIKTGQLNLANISKMAGHFKDQKTPIQEKEKILGQIENKNARQVDQLAIGLWGDEAVKPKEVVKPISKTQIQVSVTLDEETLGLLNELKGELLHKGVKDLAGVIKELCKERKEQKLKERNKALTFAQNETVATSKSISRAIPRPIRRQVFIRAQYKCEHATFVTQEAAPTACGSTFGLEIDHIKPWSHGGTHDAANLRVLCQAHHSRESFKIFQGRWKK